MAKGKLGLATLIASLFALPLAVQAEGAATGGTTIGEIQQAANEIARLKAAAAVDEIQLSLDDRREASTAKKKEREEKERAKKIAEAPPAPLVPVKIEPIEVPVGQGVTLLTVQGVGDRLVAVIKFRGAEMNVKNGDELPSGEKVSEITPTSLKLTRLMRIKKAVSSKSKVIYFGDSAVDFGAAPQLPPLPPRQQESIPGIGMPPVIRQGS